MNVISLVQEHSAFRNWTLAGHDDVVGLVPNAVADILLSEALFCKQAGRLCLVPGDVGALLESVRTTLANRGLIEPFRGEEMPVILAPGMPPIAGIDRSAMRILGLWATKVHINGICPDPEGQPSYVWLAQRSRVSRAAPGAYDTLVAGGVPIGEDARETAMREAAEEAGLAAEACQPMTPAGEITALYASDQGYHRERLVIYDLLLPEAFEPICMDGEIERFDRVALTELGKMVTTHGAIKTSSGLVCDNLLRRLAFA